MSFTLNKKTVSRKRERGNERATVKRKKWLVDTSIFLDESCDTIVDPRNISENMLREKRNKLSIRF